MKDIVFSDKDIAILKEINARSNTENRLLLLAEESAELITAILHLFRNSHKSNKDDKEAFLEEIADVLILIKDRLLYMENDIEKINNIIHEKLERTKKRLDCHDKHSKFY